MFYNIFGRFHCELLPVIVYLYSTNEYYQVVVKTWFDYFSNKSLVLSDEDLFTPFESKRKLFALIANSSFQNAVRIVFSLPTASSYGISCYIYDICL